VPVELLPTSSVDYAYVDNILEARKVFVQEMGGTLHTVAKGPKDAKIT
jgi:Ca-activated chloride channel family protein